MSGKAVGARWESFAEARDPELRHYLLHLRENCVVATSRAPSHLLVRDKVLSTKRACHRYLLLQHAHNAAGYLRNLERPPLNLVASDGVNQIFRANQLQKLT
jgi:hypothetical protein